MNDQNRDEEPKNKKEQRLILNLNIGVFYLLSGYLLTNRHCTSSTQERNDPGLWFHAPPVLDAGSHYHRSRFLLSDTLTRMQIIVVVNIREKFRQTTE